MRVAVMRKQRRVTEFRGKIVPEAEGQVLSFHAGEIVRENERRERIKVFARRPRSGDTVSVRFAMRAIEQRIVRGLWVLEISQAPDGPKSAAKHGIEYMRERIDHFAAGEWQHGPARPPVPSNKEIDAAREAQAWIGHLDEDQARFFTVAAMTKRGERDRRVNWDRVIARIPQLHDTPMRTLQERYDRALRWLVASLTVDMQMTAGK